MKATRFSVRSRSAESHRRAAGASRPFARVVILLLLPMMGTTWVVAQDAAPTEDDPHLLLNRAMMLYNAREYADSETCLTRLLEADPQNMTARFLRALSCGQQAVPRQWAARRLAVQGETERQKQEETAARELYARMHADLDILLREGLPSREAVVLLLDAVTRVKLAGMPDVPQVEQTDLLDHARQSLEHYLQRAVEPGQIGAGGLNRVRGRFFLGVILYRQAVPPVEEGQDRVVDLVRLEEAHRVLSAMVDESSPEYVETVLAAAPREEQAAAPHWLSYPYFYLGLVSIHQAGRQTNFDRAQLTLKEAQRQLEQARRYDTDPEGQSRSNVITERANDLIAKIEAELAKARPAIEPAEDFRLDWRMGLTYDTNVILLGERTDIPREIGRSKDTRFETGVALGYTLDLAKLSPDLEGLTLGLGGRSSGRWHGDVTSYNEQDHGGSVALQYELLKSKRDEDGPEHGPLFFAVQYDYDYFLLGNDGFLRNNRVTPRFALYTFDQRALTTFGMRYEDRNYLEPLYDRRYNRDGNYLAFFLNQAYDAVDMTALYRGIGWEPWGLRHDPQEGDTIDQRWLRPYVGVEYGWDATRGEEWDCKNYLLAAGVEVPLPYGVMFDFRGEWRWENYGGTRGGSLIDFHRRGRDDFVQRYGFGLERSFVLVPGLPENRRTIKVDRVVLTLRGDVQFVIDDSNVRDRSRQAVFSYERALYGFSLVLSFN